jgi:hypothetical protein
VRIGPARPRWLARWRAVARAEALADVAAAVAAVLADSRIVAVRWLARDPWTDDGEPALLDPREPQHDR